jgi:hypothetical protein
VPGGDQRAGDVPREPNFIFNNQNAHAIFETYQPGKLCGSAGSTSLPRRANSETLQACYFSFPAYSRTGSDAQALRDRLQND